MCATGSIVVYTNSGFIMLLYSWQCSYAISYMYITCRRTTSVRICISRHSALAHNNHHPKNQNRLSHRLLLRVLTYLMILRNDFWMPLWTSGYGISLESFLLCVPYNASMYVLCMYVCTVCVWIYSITHTYQLLFTSAYDFMYVILYTYVLCVL